jgi:hypothetical protein
MRARGRWPVRSRSRHGPRIEEGRCECTLALGKPCRDRFGGCRGKLPPSLTASATRTRAKLATLDAAPCAIAARLQAATDNAYPILELTRSTNTPKTRSAVDAVAHLLFAGRSTAAATVRECTPQPSHCECSSVTKDASSSRTMRKCGRSDFATKKRNCDRYGPRTITKGAWRCRAITARFNSTRP